MKSSNQLYKKCIFLSLIILLSSQIFAQSKKNLNHKTQIDLSGRVFNSKSKLPVFGISIYLKPLNIGTATSIEGKYFINNIIPGKYIIVLSGLGYKKIEKPVELKENLQMDFFLEEAPLKLSEIIVNGSKPFTDITLHNVTVLEGDKLVNDRGQTVTEALGKLPGITLLQTGPSISKPVIRGMHSQRIVVINSGVEQEGQQWGAEHAPEIDPFAPSSIEVIKGAVGLEYGAGAIGGVIKILPRKLPVKPGLSGFLQLNGFSNNRQVAGSFLIEDQLPFMEEISWQAQISYRKAGDSKTSDYILGNTGFEEKDGSFSVGYSKGGLNIKSYFSHFETELGIYKGSHIGNLADLERAITYGKPPVDYTFSYQISAPKQNIIHNLWALTSVYEIINIGTIELTYGWQSNQRQEFDARRRYSDSINIAPVKPAFDLVLTSQSFDLKFKHNPISNFYGTFGLSGMNQLNVGNSLSFLIPNFESYLGGIYLIENWSKDQLFLDFGVRYDFRKDRIYKYLPKFVPDTTLTYQNITTGVGIQYVFSSSTSITLNIESAWRTPSINELFSNGVHHGTAQYEIGNQKLKGEQSKSANLTLNYGINKFSAHVGLFYSWIDNYIFLLPNPQPTLTLRGLFPTFSYMQANSVIKGIDGEFSYSFSEIFSLNIGFSIIRGDNLIARQPLFQIPADRIRIVNRFNLPDFPLISNSYLIFSANLTAKQTRYPQNADYLNPPNGYVLYEAEYSGDIRFFSNNTLHFGLAIKNLFNTAYRDYLSRYRYFANDTGRNIVLHIRIPFGNTNDI